MIRFEPVPYDHAAAFIDQTPARVSRDPDLLAEAHLAAIRTYGLKSCVAGMDIYNVEAEAMGCDVSCPDDNGIPSIVSHPCASLAEITDRSFDPRTGGRIALLLQAAGNIRTAYPDMPVYIPMAGPFTNACQLRGMENTICDLFMDPAAGGIALDHLTGLLTAYADAIARQGFGIALFESSVTPPLLSPDMYRGLVAPRIKTILAAASGTYPPQLIIGGDTVQLAADQLQSGAGYVICPVETDQAAFIQAASEYPDITVRVNMNPAVFLPGRLDDAIKEAERVKKLAASRPHTTAGCLLPFATDPETVLGVRDLFTA